MAPVGSVPAASPTTYIESGTVASEISGASVAPTIEPVAKITAELAPVSACAAASRTTLDRARASPEISSAAVMSIIGQFRPGARPDRSIGRIDSGTMNAAAGPINRRKRARAMRRRSGRFRSGKHQDQVVGRHFGNLDQHKTGFPGQLFHSLDIAYAPFGVPFAKARVEHGIADRGMLAAALERPVQKQPTVRAQVTPRAFEQPFRN